MRYWDSSALVMLFVEQPKSAAYLLKAEEDPRILTAWHAVPECASAFCRLRRENVITELELNDLMAQLELQSKQWFIITPGNRLEKLSLRALRVHSLRAMDAIHLAAAMLACGGIENHPSGIEIGLFRGGLLPDVLNRRPPGIMKLATRRTAAPRVSIPRRSEPAASRHDETCRA